MADRVIQERNGKHGVIGVFDRIGGQANTALPLFFVFLVVSNLTKGKHPLAMNLIDHDTKQQPFNLNGEIEVNDERGVFTVGIPVPNLSLPRPGKWHWQLYIDGEFLRERAVLFAEPTSTTGGNQ